MKQEKLGDCFEVNGKYFIREFQHSNCKLVHGIVINSNDGKEMTHCWIEDDDKNLCIDISNGNDVWMDRSLYYDLGQVSKTVRYGWIEYGKKILKTGTYGSWELNCNR